MLRNQLRKVDIFGRVSPKHKPFVWLEAEYKEPAKSSTVSFYEDLRPVTRSEEIKKKSLKL